MSKSQDPGLGSKFSEPVNRLLNPDGTYNIIRVGGLRGFKDLYKYLLDISWTKFLMGLIGIYLTINLFFAGLYMLFEEPFIGTSSGNPLFWDCFFFSTQTFTTLGYGAISPNGFSANLLASFEAFGGLLFSALATGVLFGRFSQPDSKIAFSDKVIIRDFEESKALMFKLVNQRNNVLLKTKASCIFILDKTDATDKFSKEYNQLELETDYVLFFPLTWTLVHKIGEKSPLYGLNKEDLQSRHAELVVFIETFDETFGREIVQKHSYAEHQWTENVKFEMNYKPNKKGQIELNVNDLNKLQSL
jgi:inward rectifier potassium channel